MERVLCSAHGHPCVLKTGIRDGPNKDKSFYICGVKHQEPCGFVLPTKLSPSHCLAHEKYVVELQVLMKLQETDTYRLFFRCSRVKLEGKKWCGSVPWQVPVIEALYFDSNFERIAKFNYAHMCNTNSLKGILIQVKKVM